jgi:TonB family protein
MTNIIRSDRVVLIAFTMALLPPVLASPKDKKQQEAEALLAKAREVSDIRCDGCPPFRLTARFWTQQSTGRQLGDYSLTWASARKWREEVVFQDLKFVTVAEEKNDWRAWSFEFRPYWLVELAASLDFRRTLSPRVLERAGRIRLRALADGAGKCIEAEFGKDYQGNFCFNAQTGTVSRTEASGAFPIAREWTEYEKFGDKYFPRAVRIFEGETQVTEMRVEELKIDPSISSTAFLPPENATAWPTCEKANFPKAIRMPEPAYPENLRKQGVRGKVILNVRVELDGRVGNAYVLRSTGEEFSAAAVKAVKDQWTFLPATCEGVAIPSEIIVEANFRLR